MSRRDKIQINLQTVLPLISKACRSNVVFCEKMGRYQNWVTEWKRGNNLPSPEEAARMCDILGVQPEDFITEEADIAKVRAIIGTQKQTPIETDGRSERSMRLYCNLTDDQKDALVNLMEKMTGEK